MIKFTELTKEEAQIVVKKANKRDILNSNKFTEKELKGYCSLINIEVKEVSTEQPNKAWDESDNLILLQKCTKNLIIIKDGNGKGHYLLINEEV